MRHIETIRNLGALLGYDIDTRSLSDATVAERVLDELFERGYQAGYHDGQNDSWDEVDRL